MKLEKLRGPADLKALSYDELDELAKEGRIRVSGRGKYMRPEKHRIAGVFHANAKGFGFVSIEGAKEDYGVTIDPETLKIVK